MHGKLSHRVFINTRQHFFTPPIGAAINYHAGIGGLVTALCIKAPKFKDILFIIMNPGYYLGINPIK
jgi:hypothetical protein